MSEDADKEPPKGEDAPGSADRAEPEPEPRLSDAGAKSDPEPPSQPESEPDTERDAERDAAAPGIAGEDEPEEARPSRASRAYERILPYLLPVFLSAVVGRFATQAILARAGHPAMPLDDSFIHFVFAKHLSMGHWFEYVPGEGYSSGATSFLWPILLAPFTLVLRGDSFQPIWGAWILGTLVHAATAVETGRLAARLAGRPAGIAASLMCFSFGAFAWFAWSGMETMLFAWLLVRTARLAGRALDGPGGVGPESAPAGPPPLFGDPGGMIELGAFAGLCALSRPEGAIGSGMALFALLVLGIRSLRKTRTLPRALAVSAVLAVLGAAFVPLSHFLATGHAASSTTLVKWHPANPHFSREHLAGAVGGNVDLLVRSILDGGDWTHLFVPVGTRLVLLAGLIVLPFRAFRARARWTALFVVFLLLGTLAPTTYMSFLWNRVRYVWPFATSWFVLASCLAAEIAFLVVWGGVALSRVKGLGFPRPRVGTPVLGGAIGGLFAGVLFAKLPRAIEDLAESAHAIDRQQVALGRWAATELPAGARIGVNDTGAIAYFSGHKTFDVVGLTTEGEAPYWVSGAGTRFEHYEKMPVERRPTHFIVYPQWMACPPVLGQELHEATVLDQSILGGHTMIVYQARWDLLGTGALPMTVSGDAKPADELDVADLESERDHGLSQIGLWDAFSRAHVLGVEQLVMEGLPIRRVVQDGTLADGGRAERAEDAFYLTLPPGPATLVMRVASDEPTALAVTLDDGAVDAGKVQLPGAGWTEKALKLPEGPGRRTVVRVGARGPRFTSYHYWVYGGSP